MNQHRILDMDGILHGSVGVIMGLCYQSRMRAAPASKSIAPERLPAAKQRETTRSAHGLRCLSDEYFDETRPRRMLEGKLLSGAEPTANGRTYAAKGMQFSLPVPLMFSHERPVGRVLFVHSHIDGSITFLAELANTGLDFSNALWEDITSRKIDSVSLGGVSLTGTTKGHIDAWELTETSITLLGADPGASITRVYERLPGEYSTLHAPTREIWAGPIAHWDEVNMGPRESDPPPENTESVMAVACSLSTRRRAELAALRAHTREMN